MRINGNILHRMRTTALGVLFLGSVSGLQAADGITEAFQDVILSASVPGLVGAHKFKEGDFVKQGEVILELNKKLEELETHRRELIVNTLKKDLEATRKLFHTTGSVSGEELDKKELDYQLAVAEYEIALENLHRRQVIAPFSGVVTDIAFDVGEAAQAYQPIVRLVDVRRCYLITNIDPKTGIEVQVGDTVALDIENGGSTLRVNGQIVFVSPVVDPASGLLRIKVVFENPDSQIRPGVAGRIVSKRTASRD